MRLLVVSLVKCTSTHPCGEKRGRVGRSLSSSVVVVDILVGLEIAHIHRDRRRERTLHAPPLLALVVHYMRAQRDFRCYFLFPYCRPILLAKRSRGGLFARSSFYALLDFLSLSLS